MNSRCLSQILSPPASSAEINIHQIRLHFSSFQQPGFGEPVLTAASYFCALYPLSPICFMQDAYIGENTNGATPFFFASYNVSVSVSPLMSLVAPADRTVQQLVTDTCTCLSLLHFLDSASSCFSKAGSTHHHLEKENKTVFLSLLVYFAVSYIFFKLENKYIYNRFLMWYDVPVEHLTAK